MAGGVRSCCSSSLSGTCHSETAPTSAAQTNHKAKVIQLGCHFGFGRKIRHSPQSAAATTHMMNTRRITERAVAFGFTRVRNPTRFPGFGVSWFTSGRRWITDDVLWRSTRRANGTRNNNKLPCAAPHGYRLARVKTALKMIANPSQPPRLAYQSCGFG